MSKPQSGQKTIPLRDWERFLRVADWWDRTVGHRAPGALAPVAGQSVLVKTPEAGIDARNGTTIYSATCTRCVEAESGTAGEKTIHETDEELLVYNPGDTLIPGDSYVETVLSPNGTREAVPAAFGAPLIAFTLGPGLFGSPVTVLGYWNCYDPAAPTGDPPTAPDVIVIDPAGAFPGVDEHDVGYAILAKRSDADDTQKGKWIVQYCTESYDDNHPDPPDPPDPSDNVTVVTGISWNGSEIVATKTTVNLAGSGGGSPAGNDTIGTTDCPT